MFINSNQDRLAFIDEQQEIDEADNTDEDHNDTAFDEQQEVTDNADNQDHSDTTIDNEQENANEDTDSFRAPLDINRLQNAKFLSAKEIFQFINNCMQYVFDECPPGNKSIHGFLLETKAVAPATTNRLIMTTVPKSEDIYSCLLPSDNFRIKFKKNDIYCIKQRIKGQTVGSPLKPQPSINDIVEMYRYETMLKSNENREKHISWFKAADNNSLSDDAMFEYTGTYFDRQRENSDKYNANSTNTVIR